MRPTTDCLTFKIEAVLSKEGCDVTTCTRASALSRRQASSWAAAAAAAEEEEEEEVMMGRKKQRVQAHQVGG